MNKPRIDWFRIIIELDGFGVKPHDIAAKIGCDRTTVLGWKNKEAEPRYNYGDTLISIWHEKTGKAADDVPRVASLTQRIALKV